MFMTEDLTISFTGITSRKVSVSSLTHACSPIKTRIKKKNCWVCSQRRLITHAGRRHKQLTRTVSPFILRSSIMHLMILEFLERNCKPLRTNTFQSRTPAFQESVNTVINASPLFLC